MAIDLAGNCIQNLKVRQSLLNFWILKVELVVIIVLINFIECVWIFVFIRPFGFCF
jgi:hypothetical protein